MRCGMRCSGKLLWVLAFVPAAIAAMSAVVMALWNWLLPALFAGAHAIDFWQAAGLLLLCRILFGGFRGHHGWPRRWQHARWEKMTSEERETFRNGLHKSRHCWSRAGGPTDDNRATDTPA